MTSNFQQNDPSQRAAEHRRRCGRIAQVAVLGKVIRRLLAVLLVTLLPTRVRAKDTPDYFRQNCLNCHTIGGGRLTGPDLKDVSKRRDVEWLIGFMQNPKAVVESGDAYIAKLVEESRGVVMPIAPGMTRYRAEQIIKLIEAESNLDTSQFQGIRISDKPFTEQDRLEGHAIFIGVRTLEMAALPVSPATVCTTFPCWVAGVSGRT